MHAEQHLMASFVPVMECAAGFRPADQDQMLFALSTESEEKQSRTK